MLTHQRSENEVLAVGDREFREQCLDHLEQFHSRGGTIVLVSHELELLRRLCTRAVWLEAGRIRMDGDVDAVVSAYERSRVRGA